MKTLQEKFVRLDKLGFDTARNNICDKANIEDLFTSVAEQRDSLNYLIDGIVFAVNDISIQEQQGFDTDKIKPKFSIALKFAPEGDKVKLIDIEWSSKGMNYCMPIGIFEPINLSGAICTRVSLKSFGWLKQNKVEIGSIVKVCRQGDVIPCVVDIVSKLEGYGINQPKICSFCGGKIVEFGEFLMCDEEMCIAKEAARIDKFLHVFKIKGLSWKSLVEYCKAGVILADFLENISIVEDKISDNTNISKKIFAKIKKHFV